MKYQILKLLTVLLQGVYDLMKLCPVRSKVTYISRQSNEPSMDILLIKDEIARSDASVEQVLLMRRLESGIGNRIKYCFHMFVQMYHIATSKVVVLDGYCIAVSVLRHRKSLTVIQMWHAVGNLKKFGHSILGKPEGSSEKMARAMKMHNNYSYILASSEKSRQSFAEAFDVPKEKILILNLPRVDVLRSEEKMNGFRNEIYGTFGALNNGKKNILYVPTFRKNGAIDYDGVVRSVDYENYNLIVKPHTGGNRLYVNRRPAGGEGRTFQGMEWLSVADYVITDYSAIVFEAAVVGKPLYFYAFDLEEYEKDRGFYIDYRKEMPGVLSGDIRVIMDSIKNDVYDKKKIKEFADTYVELKKEGGTKEIAGLILKSCR